MYATNHIRVGRLAVATVYLVGFLQGLTLVSFPASSAVFKQLHGFSDAQYGALATHRDRTQKGRRDGR